MESAGIPDGGKEELLGAKGIVLGDSALEDFIARYKLPLLTEEDEMEFAQRIQAGKEAALQLAATAVQSLSEVMRHELQQKVRHGEIALEHLIRANVRLVGKYVWRLRLNHMSLNDIFQEGMLGLYKAACDFRPYSGARFATYAIPRIQGTMLRGLANDNLIIRVPVEAGEALNKVAWAWTYLADKQSNEPSAADILELLDSKKFTLAQVQEYLAIMRRQPISFDQPASHVEDVTIGNMLAGEESGEDVYIGRITTQEYMLEIMDVIAQLPHLQRQVVYMMFYGAGEEATLRGIAKSLQLTKGKVEGLWNVARRDLAVELARRGFNGLPPRSEA